MWYFCLWISTYGLLWSVNVSGNEGPTEDGPASWQLKKVPDCRYQVVPEGMLEWRQESSVSVEWSYQGNVSVIMLLLEY